MAAEKPYADYAWYTTDYGGSTIPEATFQTLAVKASYLVDSITAGNLNCIETLPDCVKDAVCGAAEKLYQYDQSKDSSGRGVKSENNDAYSISYADVSSESVLADAVTEIRTYLSTSGLLFRGCRRVRRRRP